MDDRRFDTITRAFGAGTSRRMAITALGGGTLLALLGRLGLGSGSAGDAAAEEVGSARKRRRKGKKQKLQQNAFGCVAVGGHCRGNDGNCCSGVCEGKKPKKGKKDKSTCVAHNSGTCQVGDDFCLGNAAECGVGTTCLRTTGDAPFCAKLGIGACQECTKDAECAALFGPGAACAVCPLECTETTTLCIAPGA